MPILGAMQGPVWCPMCGGGWGAWGWGGMLLMALFWIAVVVAVIWFLARIARGQGRTGNGGGRDRAEEILRERYARGEIDRESFERMMEDLRRGR